MPHETTFPVWRKITIGGVSKDELWRNIWDAFSVGLNTLTREAMHHGTFTTLRRKKSLNLCRRKISDLGFTTRPTVREVQTRIQELGHLLCPAEVGPHLALLLFGQSKGALKRERLDLQMEPIRAQLSCDVRFYVAHGGRNDEVYFGIDISDEDTTLFLENVIVFVLNG
jgi:hypothetical protein